MNVYKVRNLTTGRYIGPPKSGRIYTNIGHIKTSFRTQYLKKRTDIEIVEFELNQIRVHKPNEV